MVGAVLGKNATISASQVFGTVSVLAMDPGVYAERWRDIAQGLVPYIEVEFEHFPLALLLISMTGIISDSLGIQFTALFPWVTGLLTGVTAYVVHRTSLAMEEPRGVLRFLILIASLLPLTLYRADILPTLFAALAMMAWVQGHDLRGTTAAIAGVLAKGWPALLAATEFWRGSRLRALVLGGSGLVVGAVLLSLPGFQSGRAFSGIHQETVAGSVILFWRHLSGARLGHIYQAGAVYIDTAWWVPLVNFAFGASLGVLALTGIRKQFNWRRAHLMAAALTCSLLLASPLLSAQFLVWPVAFLALVARYRVIALHTAASLITVVLVGFWDNHEFWWSSALLARNLILIALTTTLVVAAANGREHTR